jgi:hypothetical protein
MGHTLALAFLQLTHAFRVTDSGTLLRFDELELLLSTAFPLRARFGSEPVDSDVDTLGLLAEALLSAKEGRIFRKDMALARGSAIGGHEKAGIKKYHPQS